MPGGRGGRRRVVHTLLPQRPQGAAQGGIREEEDGRQGLQGDVQVLRLAPRENRLRDGILPRGVQERRTLQGAGSGRPVGRVHGILSREGRPRQVVHVQGDGGLPHVRAPQGQRRGDDDPRIRREHREGVRTDGGGDGQQMRHRGPADLRGPPHGHEGRRERQADRRGRGLLRRHPHGRPPHVDGRIRAGGRCEERRPQGRDGNGHAGGGARHREDPRQVLPGRRKRNRRHIRMGGLHEADRGRALRGPSAEARAGAEPPVRTHGEGLGRRKEGHLAGGPGRGSQA